MYTLSAYKDGTECSETSAYNFIFLFFLLYRSFTNKDLKVLVLMTSLTRPFYMPTFRNTLFHFHRQVDVQTICLWRWNRVFRNVGI